MNKTQIHNSRKVQTCRNKNDSRVVVERLTRPEPLPHAVGINRISGTLAAIAQVGRIVGFCDGTVYIDFDGNDHGPRVALTTVPLRNLEEEVIFLLLSGGQPVIIGQLYSSALLQREGGDVLIAGRTVRIETDSELILRSGTSKIHLDARGRVVTSADHVVSRARAANKIQGGSVQIN
jgi:hypothetical protein